MKPQHQAVARSYSAVAADYAAQMFHELDHKPLDRALLDCLAEQVVGGTVLDVGCGPGQVARYLHDQGLATIGIDLAPGMIEVARQRSPDVPFEEGSILALPVEDGSCSGVVAFYSIIHLRPQEIPHAFSEFYRVLRDGGLVLLAFHLGTDLVYRDEWWGHAVDLDFYFLEREPIERALESVGFTLEVQVERTPIPDVEFASRRCYLIARKQAHDSLKGS